MKDRMFEWVQEVLAGERAKRPKPAKTKTARERRRGEGNCWEGNSPAWRKGGAIDN
jgi:hypothetical protein